MGKLLSWFGPSRKEVWQKLATQLDARYSDGTWNKSARLEVDHGPWTITLDTFVVMAGNVPITYTRFRAPYRNVDKFRMKIHRASIFAAIGKLFGMQDIEVGALQFDADFVVRANDVAMVKRFCRKASLRRQIMALKTVTIEIVEEGGWFGPKYPQGTDVLSVVTGSIKEPGRYEAFFELFAEALDQLCEIGAAYAEAPDYEL